ncbi:MAG: Ig-like domain-containing protein, partial [Anaerolineae bacterium]
WQAPVIVDRSTSTDKQWIMGDQDPQGTSPYAGNLYMSWTSFGGTVTGIVFSRSTDANQTWSAPIALAGGDIQGSIVGTAPDGTVYVVFGRGIFYGGAGTMEFVKSTNGGLSFTSPALAANITAIPYNLPNPFGGTNFRSPASLPAFAVSPVDGNLYVAWADYRNGDSDIYLTRSTDGGTTWSAPVRLNDDPVGNGIDQFQPQVSVAPNGRVAVMWFDRRLACPDLPWIPAAHVGVYNGCIDTFMTRSFDEGVTWVPNIRASAQTWDWTLNLPWTGSDGFIGDYQGIASNDDYDFPFWNATADLGENPDRYQQVFVARVPAVQEPVWDLSPSSKYVEPGVVQPGDPLTYTLILENAGPDDAPAVHMTDTLPLSTTYISGSLAFSAGAGGYDPATQAITWTGPLSVGLPVTGTFRVTVGLDLEEGAVVTNTALISDGASTLYEIEVTATVHVPLPPMILVTDPADGSSSVPITASLVVTFNEPLIAGSLAYTITPPVSDTLVAWNTAGTVLTLSHGGLAYSQTYTVTVAAHDLEGLALVPGPVPNPWSFTTGAAPPPPRRYYLPLVVRHYMP